MNEESKQPLLIIEDSDEDFAALQRMIVKAQIPNPIYRCEDGEEALLFLYRQEEYEDESLSPRPSLIVLDLNLPGTDGREVLAQIKKDKDLQTIPVVIFSTSSNPKDINTCYRCGVSGYMVKPMDLNRLNDVVKTFLEYWFQTVELPNP